MVWPIPRRSTSSSHEIPEAPEHLDDRGLMRRAQQGDADAFGTLYERHRTSVYRYIAFRTLYQDVAEDLTAEVFLNAWRAVSRYQERGTSVRSWLLRLAHNEVVDHYRAHRNDASLPDDGPLTPLLEGPEQLRALHDEQVALVRALHQLSEETQQLLLLRFVERLSFEAIGAVLGKQSNACRQMQHRALARLRMALMDEREAAGG